MTINNKVTKRFISSNMSGHYFKNAKNKLFDKLYLLQDYIDMYITAEDCSDIMILYIKFSSTNRSC